MKSLAELDLQLPNLLRMLQTNLQVFSSSITESLSMLQSKVLGLEHVVERIAQQGGRCSDTLSSKLIKQSQPVVSPRVSTCSSRSSVDNRNRQPSLFSGKNSEIWDDKSLSRGRSRISAKEGAEMWNNPTTVRGNSRNLMQKDIDKSSLIGAQGVGQVRKTKAVTYGRVNNLESKNSLWEYVKGYLRQGDLDSAYAKALYAGNELVLVELLDGTGPVLERLSPKTISYLLTTLASYFLEQRFMNSIIPWLQQASLSILRYHCLHIFSYPCG